MTTTEWDFPTMAHVWEYRNDAIIIGGDRLDALSGTERGVCLAALSERVRMLVGQLDDGWLIMTAFWMAEDLYKSCFRWFQWTPGMRDYIAGTAPVVLQELQRRGYVLHYIVDATEGEANIATMLTVIPEVFQAAGLAVVGPQIAAVHLLMKDTGQPPADIAEIQRYRDAGHAMADAVVTDWHAARRSSAYLNLDFDDGLPGLPMDVALSQRGVEGTVVVFRNAAPTEGSQAHFFPPPGVVMPPGVPSMPAN